MELLGNVGRLKVFASSGLFIVMDGESVLDRFDTEKEAFDFASLKVNGYVDDRPESDYDPRYYYDRESE